MSAFDLAETFYAMQREILRATAQATSLMWMQAIELTDSIVRKNPFVPESNREFLHGFLVSYLDFMEKKGEVLSVMNEASEDILSFVCKSTHYHGHAAQNRATDICEQVLNAVKGGNRK